MIDVWCDRCVWCVYGLCHLWMWYLACDMAWLYVPCVWVSMMFGYGVVYMFLHVWFTYSVCVEPECCLWGAGCVSDTDSSQCCFSSLNFPRRWTSSSHLNLLTWKEKFSKWLGGQKQSLRFEKCLEVGKVFLWPLLCAREEVSQDPQIRNKMKPCTLLWSALSPGLGV